MQHRDGRRRLLKAAIGLAAGVAVAPRLRPLAAAEDRAWSRPLADLADGRWTKIHELDAGFPVLFRRQSHGGSCFDSRRGRLVLFGSDTHGQDWTNSPLFFDLGTRAWSRLYANDPPESYRVNADGLPVAGPNGDHPWAMHTFGAVVYDADGDRMVVSSYPEHLRPGRFTNALAHVWPGVRRHPTWMLDLATGRWAALPGKAEHFFAFATVFCPDRRSVIGYRQHAVFELDLRALAWRKLAPQGLSRWGGNAVYDSRHGAVVAFGSHKKDNDVGVFEPASGRIRTMPTPGPRPRGDRGVPMAFHARIGATVAVVDRDPAAQVSPQIADTWLYDLARDAWTRVDGASLPFGVGRNYNLAYAPGDDLLVLVTDPPGRHTSVYALRL